MLNSNLDRLAVQMSAYTVFSAYLAILWKGMLVLFFMIATSVVILFYLRPTDLILCFLQHFILQHLPMQPATVVFQIPDYAEMHQMADRLNVTLYAASPQYVCLSDGAGHIYLIKTGDREQNLEWKVGSLYHKNLYHSYVEL